MAKAPQIWHRTGSRRSLVGGGANGANGANTAPSGRLPQLAIACRFGNCAQGGGGQKPCVASERGERRCRPQQRTRRVEKVTKPSASESSSSESTPLGSGGASASSSKAAPPSPPPGRQPGGGGPDGGGATGAPHGGGRTVSGKMAPRGDRSAIALSAICSNRLSMLARGAEARTASGGAAGVRRSGPTVRDVSRVTCSRSE